MTGRKLLGPAIGAAAAIAALVAPARPTAAELDPETGLLVADPGAVLIGFEDASQLADLGVALTRRQGGGPGAPSSVAFLNEGGAPVTEAQLAAHVATDPAVEGAKALLIGTGTGDEANGVLVPFAKVAPLLGKPKVRVTAWVRTEFATPSLVATYSTAALPAGGSFASVAAIRTGRETSDGWAELSTGPIDAAVWGVPLAQITAGYSRGGWGGGGSQQTARIAIDAIEIAPVEGDPLPATPCTMATQDAACGPDGECRLGHCLPAYASWGPTPGPAHRADFVDRWIALAKHVQAARNSATNAAAMVAARPALTADTVGGRAFFAGMIALVNGLRNHHTGFGTPGSQGLVQPLAAGGSSSTLGACLGIGRLDLLEEPGAEGMRLGFVVFDVASSSLVGAALKPGDAITKIDGIDPFEWVRGVYTTYATGVPADPGADMAWAAPGVAWMISHRASTVEVTSCASATACAGDDRKVFEIDVAGPAWASVQGTGVLGGEDLDPISCAVRFRDTLPPARTGNGGNNVAVGEPFDDVTALQFDGTLQDFAVWQGQVLPAFPADAPPARVLFDVRVGHGGYAENAQFIAEEIRPGSQPIGIVGLPTTAWNRWDAVPDLLDVIAAADPSCRETSLETLATSPCDLVVEDYFLGDWLSQAGFLESLISPGTPCIEFTPAGVGARVAWLQSANVSANDYLAALVEGRANQRVFGTGPTSGAYGTITSIPALLLGWRGGSVQMSDSLWGPDFDALDAAAWRSGSGVPPDEVVAQRMSDAMNGVDTMIEAARAWLAAGDRGDGRGR